MTLIKVLLYCFSEYLLHLQGLQSNIALYERYNNAIPNEPELSKRPRCLVFSFMCNVL